MAWLLLAWNTRTYRMHMGVRRLSIYLCKHLHFFVQHLLDFSSTTQVFIINVLMTLATFMFVYFPRYPGPSGTPLGSLRLSNIADGIEDWQLFHRLGSTASSISNAADLITQVSA